jgi:Amino acid permease
MSLIPPSTTSLIPSHLSVGTTYGSINHTHKSPPSQDNLADDIPTGVLPGPSTNNRLTTLHRGLSSRQVQMIAIGGTIGTGLFLGTGRSLAQGGPASMLICYSIVGVVVYVTLLLLGEMATQYPIPGKPHYSQSRSIVERAFLVMLTSRFSIQGLSMPTPPDSFPQPTDLPFPGIIGSTTPSPSRPTSLLPNWYWIFGIPQIRGSSVSLSGYSSSLLMLFMLMPTEN